MHADDFVYCSKCNEKDGDDFLLCDACDGGMHKSCAKLDQVPDGFWACKSCKKVPTVKSAVRQVRKTCVLATSARARLCVLTVDILCMRHQSKLHAHIV